MAGAVLVAAVICGKEYSRVEFAPAKLLLQLSVGCNDGVKIWRERREGYCVSSKVKEGKNFF